MGRKSTKPIRKAVKSADGDVEKALWGNHRHLEIHARIIEKLLASDA